MKKCSICEREVEDFVMKCPHCGHDFNYTYKKDQKAFDERFAPIDNPREAVGNSLMSLTEEYADEKGSDESQTLSFKGIKNRTEEQEKRLCTLEVRNRNYSLIFLTIVLCGISLFLIYTTGFSINKLFVKYGMYGSFIATFVSVLFYYIKKSKIIQDLAFVIVFGQYSYLIGCYIMENISRQWSWLHYAYYGIGIIIAFWYCKYINRVYPLMLVGLLIAAIEMSAGYSYMRSIKYSNSSLGKDIFINCIDMVFSTVAAGFIIVFIFDILKMRKSINTKK